MVSRTETKVEIRAERKIMTDAHEITVDQLLEAWESSSVLAMAEQNLEWANRLGLSSDWAGIGALRQGVCNAARNSGWEAYTTGTSRALALLTRISFLSVLARIG